MLCASRDLKYYQFNNPDEIITLSAGDDIGLQRIANRSFFIHENNILTFKTAKDNKSKLHDDYNLCYFMNSDLQEEKINDIKLLGDDHYSNMDVFGKNKDKFYIIDEIFQNDEYKRAMVVSDFNGNVEIIELK